MALVEYAITHLQSGGLITNYFCPSRCRHCLYNADPHWPKKYIDLFGNYISGLCAGLSIWRDDLGKPLAEGKYPILTTLFHSGIRALARMAQRQFGSQQQVGISSITQYALRYALCAMLICAASHPSMAFFLAVPPP